MERLRRTFFELSSIGGPPARRRRFWKFLPDLLRQVEDDARHRSHGNARQAASHLALGEVYLESLGSDALLDLAEGSPDGPQQLGEVRELITRLMMRYATRPCLPDPMLRDLTAAVGDDRDPFGRLRGWPDRVEPGRGVLPEGEIRACRLDRIAVESGLLIQRPRGGLSIRSSLLSYLWFSRLRRDMRVNRVDALICLNNIAGIDRWTNVLVLLAEHLEGHNLTAFLASIAGMNDTSCNAEDGRLAQAALCLARVPPPGRLRCEDSPARLPQDDPTAIAIARAATTRVLTRLEQETRNARSPQYQPSSAELNLERAVRGIARWLDGVDVRLGPVGDDGVLREQWIQRIDREPDDARNRNLTIIRRIPELFATPSILNWLGEQIRQAPRSRRRTRTDLDDRRQTLSFDALEYRHTLEQRAEELLGWTGILLRALGRAAVTEMLLVELIATLQNQREAVAARGAAAAILLGPDDRARLALEPWLIAIANHHSHEPATRNLAAQAAVSLASIDPTALDWIHEHGPGFRNIANRGRSEAEAEARRRLETALGSRLLARLGESQEPHDLIETLSFFRAMSPGVTPRVLRRIERLIRDPRREVQAAAARALVAMVEDQASPRGTTRRWTTAGDARRRIDRLLTSRSHTVRLVVLRAIPITNSCDPPLTPESLARLFADPSAEVREAAVRLARSQRQWLREESFLATLRTTLASGGPAAWGAAVDLWRHVVESDADEPLASVLANHDATTWRQVLVNFLELPTMPGDEELWRNLSARIPDGPVPGGAAAWRTPNFPIPDDVQSEIGRSLLVYGERWARAEIAVQALAPRGPLPGVWDELVNVLEERCDAVERERALDALRLISRLSGVPAHVVARITDMLPPRVADDALWVIPIRALAKLGSPVGGCECIHPLIERLSNANCPYPLQDAIRTLLKSLPPVMTRAAAGMALSRAGMMHDRIGLIRFAIVPLSRNGDLDCLEHLISQLHDDEVSAYIVGDVVDMMRDLPPCYLRRIVENFGFNEAISRLGDLGPRAARELADHENSHDCEFWSRVAYEGQWSPEVREVALTVLAAAPGWRRL